MVEQTSRLTSLSPAWGVAHELARHELYVIPVDPESKRPLTSDGFKAATIDHTRIARWAKACPRARIGVAVGLSGVAVIDVDPRNDPDLESLKMVEAIFDGLDTPRVRTAGGGFISGRERLVSARLTASLPRVSM